MQIDLITANQILSKTGISVVDAALLVRNMLDGKSRKSTKNKNLKYCRTIIDCGTRHYREENRECTLRKAFTPYLQSKTHLSKNSFHDIKYVLGRILRNSPTVAGKNFSEFTTNNCEEILEREFNSPNQFNKGKAMLSGFFSYAVRKGWCDKNPLLLVPRKKVRETEIAPLTLPEISTLLKTTQAQPHIQCAAAIGIMLWAGIRPHEVARLKWTDIDLTENVITLRAANSKTGGTRHVEILPVLKKWLIKFQRTNDEPVCPKDWHRRFKSLRDAAGFKNKWIRDILRHTYASYHAKHFHNLGKLQSEMGHRDLHLLRTRYINMTNITKSTAKDFFTKLGGISAL